MQKRRFSQVQGSAYANMFGLVERFIGARILEVSRNHWMGDQVALEALVRFTGALVRRLRTRLALATGVPFGRRPFRRRPRGCAFAS